MEIGAGLTTTALVTGLVAVYITKFDGWLDRWLPETGEERQLPPPLTLDEAMESLDIEYGVRFEEAME
jgi:hypothetical protein